MRSGGSALGPDPLEHGIDVAKLAEKLARRSKRSIKEALMDQTVLAGVGAVVRGLRWMATKDSRAHAARPRSNA